MLRPLGAWQYTDAWLACSCRSNLIALAFLVKFQRSLSLRVLVLQPLVVTFIMLVSTAALASGPRHQASVHKRKRGHVAYTHCACTGSRSTWQTIGRPRVPHACMPVHPAFKACALRGVAAQAPRVRLCNMLVMLIMQALRTDIDGDLMAKFTLPSLALMVSA